MTTNNDERVCECGHAIHEGQCNFWTHVKNHIGCHICPCDQFTDARLAALRAENNELRDKVCGLEAEVNEGGWMDKYNAKCRRVKELHAEIARLTPTATRELPTREGWYWRVNDEIGEWEIVHVRADLDGRLYTESRDDDGTVVIDLVLRGKWWSREPIPPMTIPESEANREG